MRKFIKKILNNPGVTFALFLGGILGALTTSVFFFTDTSWLVDYLKEQWIHLGVSIITVIVVIILYMLFKKSIFKVYSENTDDGLSDFTEKATRLFTFFLKPDGDRGSFTCELEATVKQLTNYFVSFMVVSSLTRYLFVLFGALLGSAGTILLVKQNEIMELQRVHAVEAQLSQRMKLPSEIRQFVSVPDNKHKFEYQAFTGGGGYPSIIELQGNNNRFCNYEYDLTVKRINPQRKPSDLKSIYTPSYYSGIAVQMRKPELKTLVCPILSNILFSSSNDETLGALKLLSLLDENDFQQICSLGEPSFDYSNQPIELHYLSLMDGLDLSKSRNIKINISESIINGLQLPSEGDNDILIYNSIISIQPKELEVKGLRLRNSVLVFTNYLEESNEGFVSLSQSYDRYSKLLDSLITVFQNLEDVHVSIILPTLPKLSMELKKVLTNKIDNIIQNNETNLVEVVLIPDYINISKEIKSRNITSGSTNLTPEGCFIEQNARDLCQKGPVEGIFECKLRSPF